MDINTIKERLFADFGGFADKRIKNLKKSDYFTCDENASTDPKGKLYPWYCTIGINVISGDLVHVQLGAAMPKSYSVLKWCEANAIDGKSVIPIGKGEEYKLFQLTSLIRAITKVSYKVKAYKYECPRVADVLKRVEKLLKKAFA